MVAAVYIEGTIQQDRGDGMEVHCNGEAVGGVEHVEWKKETDDGGTVTFHAPFEFDWETRQNEFLELAAPDGRRYILSTLRRIDEGSTGTFVVAEYKPLGNPASD